jgi:hypothetical protein
MAPNMTKRESGTPSTCNFWVELRGFEPLTPSMRTLGGEVARGRWGRSAVDRSLSEPLAVDDVAVFECCTALDLSTELGAELPRFSGLPRYDTKLWMRDLMEGAAYLPK